MPDPHPHHELPLTEAAPTATPAVSGDEALIRQLVNTFYERIRHDAVLGPIFMAHVADWSLHLPKMYDFWSSVVLGTRRYAGRPIDAHRRLPNLAPSHFDRWLNLWRQTVAELVPPAAQRAFIRPAENMAAAMATDLGRTVPRVPPLPSES